MWNLQSYPTTGLNERMWHFKGGGVKTYSDPSYIFSAGQDSRPQHPGSAPLSSNILAEFLTLWDGGASVRNFAGLAAVAEVCGLRVHLFRNLIWTSFACIRDCVGEQVEVGITMFVSSVSHISEANMVSNALYTRSLFTFGCWTAEFTVHFWPKPARIAIGERRFSHYDYAPRIWNSLPTTVRSADSYDSFKARLKTHLVDTVWRWRT